MSNFILAELGRVHRNCFDCTLDLYLDEHERPVNVLAKIDTGCFETCISFPAFAYKIEKLCMKQLKEIAIDKKLEATISFGVNDSIDYQRKQRELFNIGNYQDCTAISFYHNISNCKLNGYSSIV